LNHRKPARRRVLPVALTVAALAAAAGIAACTTGADDLAYPNISRPTGFSAPRDLMTPAEREAAIAELRASAAPAATASTTDSRPAD
jgi:hypothetical protein